MGARCTLLRPGTLAYDDAWHLQRRLADDVRGGSDAFLILLRHPHTYTLGARGNTGSLLASRDALAARGAAVVQSDRGGDVTYHGPGQIVGYPIVNLRAPGLAGSRTGRGAVWYVRTIEQVMIDALSAFGIEASRIMSRPGVWVDGAKIGAIGVRVSRGVTTHGFALNVSTDLSYFQHIVPCGIADAGVTSMEAVAGRLFALADVEDALAAAFARLFEMDVIADEAMVEAAIGR